MNRIRCVTLAGKEIYTYEPDHHKKESGAYCI